MAISKLGFHFSNRGNHQSGDKYLDDATSNATIAKIDEIIDVLNNLEVEDFKSQVSFNEEPGNFVQFKRIGNIVIIVYQGANKEHAYEDLLFTIPAKYAPKVANVTAPFSEYAAAYGQILIRTSGEVIVNLISSTSASGRIVFNVVYTI